MISFAHYKNTPNIGDQMCAPYHYFDFGDWKSFDLSDEIPESEAVIFGGGAIEPKLRSDGLHRAVNAGTKVAWGVGTSRRGHTTHGPLVDDLDLIGVREYGREQNVKKAFYVPCASCMSPALDKDYEVEHEVVFYTHGVYALPESDGLPRLNNRAPTLEDAIAFIASGDVVVTNSFHGTYWALLLGRKTVCLPFSSKFYGFMTPPEYCVDGDWRAAMSRAKNHHDYLSDSRARNLEFYDRVRSMISVRRRRYTQLR